MPNNDKSKWAKKKNSDGSTAYFKVPTDRIIVSKTEDERLRAKPDMSTADRTKQVREMINYDPGSNLKGEAAKKKSVEYDRAVYQNNAKVRMNTGEARKGQATLLDRGTPKANNTIASHATERYLRKKS